MPENIMKFRHCAGCKADAMTQGRELEYKELCDDCLKGEIKSRDDTIARLQAQLIWMPVGVAVRGRVYDICGGTYWDDETEHEGHGANLTGTATAICDVMTGRWTGHYQGQNLYGFKPKAIRELPHSDEFNLGDQS